MKSRIVMIGILCIMSSSRMIAMHSDELRSTGSEGISTGTKRMPRRSAEGVSRSPHTESKRTILPPPKNSLKKRSFIDKESSAFEGTSQRSTRNRSGRDFLVNVENSESVVHSSVAEAVPLAVSPTVRVTTDRLVKPVVPARPYSAVLEVDAPRRGVPTATVVQPAFKSVIPSVVGTVEEPTVVVSKPIRREKVLYKRGKAGLIRTVVPRRRLLRGPVL
ncbi:hypothetical protein H0X06_01160 [Candidatus Dependentiae bacterium]|nr:hypothetical protein [Candidatus Dependentiae bacterium]